MCLGVSLVTLYLLVVMLLSPYAVVQVSVPLSEVYLVRSFEVAVMLCLLFPLVYTAPQSSFYLGVG